MNDFKIMDTFEEGSSSKKSLIPNNVKIVIVVILALFVGIGVFIGSNALFGKKGDDKPITTTTLTTTDKTVVELYKMVCYGDRGIRNTKFVNEVNVDMSKFTNQEKFYYAMQFATAADFSNSGNLDASGKKIYTISNDKVKEYMNKFFGPKIEYSSDGTNTITFDFSIDTSNVGTMNYDFNREAFATTFSGYNNDLVDNNIIKPYYTKLVAAVSRSDGIIEMKERIIYTEVVHNKDGYGNLIDNYSLSIYRDPNKTMLIETRNNLSLEALKQYPMSIDNYTNQSSVITYTFKKQASGYYFESSKIES